MLQIFSILQLISERAFDGLNNLRRLNLRYNRLTTLESGVFTALPVLDWLDVSGNNLETLSQVNFGPILEKLTANASNLIVAGN